MFRITFMAKIISILQKYLFFEPIQNGGKSRLEQKSVIKFLVAEKCKPCEIYKRICDKYREECFSKKMLTNKLKIDLPL